MSTSNERERALDRRVFEDPRGRSEQEWLDVLDLLVRRLELRLRNRIEVGAFWFDQGPASLAFACGGLCAQIRADGSLLSIESDCWEGSLCVTGDEDGAGISLLAFPFLQGSLLTREGRRADPAPTRDVEPFVLQYVGGRWEVHGWQFPEGPGEWAGISAPGDQFYRALRGSAPATSSRVGNPIQIRVDHVRGDGHGVGDTAMYSLHRLWRDGEELVSPTLPSIRSADGVVVGGAKLASCTLPATLAIDRIPIPDGWVAGNYRAELRVRGAPSPHTLEYLIAAPVEFAVV